MEHFRLLSVVQLRRHNATRSSGYTVNFCKGRLPARAAAIRIADHLNDERQGDGKGVYGVLFQLDSTCDEAKIADLMEELKHVEELRQRLMRR
jgi:hypothetical protein